MQKVHHYSAKTGVFEGSSDARVNPLETQKKLDTKLKEKRDAFLLAEPEATQEDLKLVALAAEEIEECQVYLLPACATFDAAPDVIEGKARVFENGAWVQKTDLFGQTVFNEVTGEEVVVDYYGDLTPGFVTEKPVIPLTAEQIDNEIEVYLSLLDNALDISEDIDPAIYAEMSVAQKKKLKEVVAVIKYDHAMNWILGAYSEPEIDSWAQQHVNALAWDEYAAANPSVADNEADYDQAKMIKEMAKGKNKVDDSGLTVEMMNERTAVIKQKADFFNTYTGGLIGTKKSVHETLSSITDESEVAHAAIDSVNTDDILATGLSYLGL